MGPNRCPPVLSRQEQRDTGCPRSPGKGVPTFGFMGVPPAESQSPPDLGWPRTSGKGTGAAIAGTGTTRHFGTASDASHLDAVTTAIHIDAAAPNGHIGAVTPNHPGGAAAPNGLIGAATPNHPSSTATTNVTPERAAPLAQSERTTQEGTPDATLGVPSDECDVSPCQGLSDAGGDPASQGGGPVGGTQLFVCVCVICVFLFGKFYGFWGLCFQQCFKSSGKKI